MNNYFLLSLLLFLSGTAHTSTTPVIKAGFVYNLKQEDDLTEILKLGNVIIDFSAEWCGPCQKMQPIFSSLAQEFAQHNIIFVKIDTGKVDLSRVELSVGAKVMSLPTFIFFRNGMQLPPPQIGALSVVQLRKMIKSKYQLP